MGNIIKLPDAKKKSKMDDLIDRLFQVLPADNHEEIATKLNRLKKRDDPAISVAYASTLLSHLRKNSHRYGWTVPHSARGAKGQNKKGPRFFHVLVERGRDPQFDNDHEENLQAGVASTLRLVASSMRNQAAALDMAVKCFKSSITKQMARHLSRQQKRLSEDAESLVEMVREENGSAA